MEARHGHFSSTASSTELGNRLSLGVSMSIYLLRGRTAGGNMIFVQHSTDFEMYSSTSKGAIQGYGYVFHKGQI